MRNGGIKLTLAPWPPKDSLTVGDLDTVGLLCRCIERTSLWMQDHFFQLDQDKTEIIVFGLKKQSVKV